LTRDFNIGKAADLMRQTLPFVGFRAAVCLAICAAMILAAFVGGMLGWLIGAFGDTAFQEDATVWGNILGLCAAGGAVYFLREHLLYMMHAGHTAVMVEAMQGQKIAQGRAQVEQGWEIVAERFGPASVLFALDGLIKAVIVDVIDMTEDALSIVPLPGAGRVPVAVRAFLRVSVGLMDEVALAQLIKGRAKNPWDGAQDALVLYADKAKAMMSNAGLLSAGMWGLTFLIFLLMLGPGAFFVWFVPGEWSVGHLVFAGIFAWAIKVAVIEPFAVACLLQVFFRLNDGQTPDPDWRARLESTSEAFQAIGQQGQVWAKGRAARVARWEETA
jgi:hypothetical protein